MRCPHPGRRLAPRRCGGALPNPAVVAAGPARTRPLPLADGRRARLGRRRVRRAPDPAVFRPALQGHDMRVLVAPDDFKGTFSAPEVAAAIARGLRAAGAEA